jgi:hypothetical protein
MKNILLLAVIALIGTAAHAQSNAGNESNEAIGKSATQSQTQGTSTEIGCPDGRCNKNLVQVPIKKNTNPTYKSGSGTETGTSETQGGTQ